MDALNRSQLINAAQAAGAVSSPSATKDQTLPVSEPPADPAAIYHGLERGERRFYAELLYSTAEWDEYMATSSPIFMDKIGAPSGALRVAYDDALSALSPELREKDWSFSVSDGRLVIEAGRDELSDEELASLHAAFDNAGAEQAAVAVANVAVEAIEKDRYWMYRHLGSGYGVYDLSEKNFDDIIDLRQYMEDYREGGRYALNPVDPTNYTVIYGGGGRALMDQIKQNSETIEVPRRKVIV